MPRSQGGGVRDHDPNYPWRCWLGGIHAGRRSTRQAAMNLVDKPYRRGTALVKHTGTGETWERDRGSWFKIEPARRHSRAACGGAGDGASSMAASPAPDGPPPVPAPRRKQLVLL